MAKNQDLDSMFSPSQERIQRTIEAVARVGAKQIDLSQCALTELPVSLSQLTQLHTLNLSSNRFKALPNWLGELKHLRVLHLYNNELTVIPVWVRELNELQTLTLSHNSLEPLPEWLGQLTKLEQLHLANNGLTRLPDSLGHLTKLKQLDLSNNRLASLPDWMGQLTRLQQLDLSSNGLVELPKSLGQLTALEEFDLSHNGLTDLPGSLGRLTNLRKIDLTDNSLAALPDGFGALTPLTWLKLDQNPLNPEFSAVYGEGDEAVIRYLRAKREAQVVLNEAKLILIGEGEVGKSCLLAALRGDPWQDERPTTHGIEIKPVEVFDQETGNTITLNGWDFGGQRVYRPTHQLFFSAPAVYLVVWKPREGPQQGFVKEWIKLVKHREPDAKILVVATHGGPKDRQPDIDRQEIWDLFGRETVIDFFHVDSQPTHVDEKTGNRTGACKGIKELKDTIGRIAGSLPEMGRTFPKHWQKVRETLGRNEAAYLPLERVFAICKKHNVEKKDAQLLLRICHRVGDLIYYEHDPALRDIVVLKPDWLATAISFVLDDKETRDARHGLVSFDRLGMLWNDPNRQPDLRYDAGLHPLFVRLMERFDLSYKVIVPNEPEDALGFWQRAKSLIAVGRMPANDLRYTSLVAQLVPDVRPEPVPGWPLRAAIGDEQQLQICRIVDMANGQSATAEGLFYQLIVRLHKYSLGRADFHKSVHWQRGLIVEDDTGARAFLEHIGTDVRIAVRSPYPERFLSALTYEVKWLVESFWTGLRCEVTVPCLITRESGEPCKGLFEVGKLLENKRRGRPEQPCQICNEWQSIEQLLHNAPAARPNPIEELLANFAEIMGKLENVRLQLGAQQAQVIGSFDKLDATSREIVSKVEGAYSGLMPTLLDEAKDGPRLFSFEPIERRGFLDRPNWISAKFKLSLWCEHSRLPLNQVSGDPNMGVYIINLPREWLVKAAPFLKLLSTTLSLTLPVVAALPKIALPEADFKGIEAELALGKSTAEFLLKGGENTLEWLVEDDDGRMVPAEAVRAEGAVLRQLHLWLKEKDPTFGGMVRVQNKRQEFLWVHPLFEGEY
jgi:internalin A